MKYFQMTNFWRTSLYFIVSSNKKWVFSIRIGISLLILEIKWRIIADSVPKEQTYAILFLNKAVKKISSNKAFLISSYMPQLLYKQGALLEVKNKLSKAFNIYKKIYVKYRLLSLIFVSRFEVSAELCTPVITWSSQNHNKEIPLWSSPGFITSLPLLTMI